MRLVGGTGAGAGAARNRGAAVAAAPVLAFTDADCVPAGDWLRAGLDCLDGADLVQGVVQPDTAAVRMPFDRTVWVERESGLYETANLFIRTATLHDLGGFEDWLGPIVGRPLAEDVWLGWRARRAGARTRFCPAARVEHAVFRRSLIAYAGERRRLLYFPAIVRKVPELRETLFWRQYFLSRRSASFNLALASLALAAVTRSGRPLLGAAPYAREATRSALGWRRHAPRALLGAIIADAVGCAALAWGSFRHRTLVL